MDEALHGNLFTQPALFCLQQISLKNFFITAESHISVGGRSSVRGAWSDQRAMNWQCWFTEQNCTNIISRISLLQCNKHWQCSKPFHGTGCACLLDCANCIWGHHRSGLWFCSNAFSDAVPCCTLSVVRATLCQHYQWGQPAVNGVWEQCHRIERKASLQNCGPCLCSLFCYYHRMMLAQPSLFLKRRACKIGM